MARPRSTLIDLNSTPYYHCIARCVRRAFLCGEDKFTGRNFDHRKQWVVDRIHLLGQLFAIDIAAYAIMSNHYHLVLHVNTTQADNWSDEEVMQRWLSIYKGPELIHRFKRQLPMTEAELLQVQIIITTWRARLCSISWFMALLNEQIAREANKEDGCTGRFWEGRFKSQALLDEAAVLSCMVYVDLNPVRAGVSDDLETSDFTSIQARIQQIKQISPEAQQPELMPFIESEHENKTLAAIPFTLKDYIELVDWSGRAVRNDKRGSINENKPKIIASIGLKEEQWLILALQSQKQSRNMLSALGAQYIADEKPAKVMKKSA